MNEMHSLARELEQRTQRGVAAGLSAQPRHAFVARLEAAVRAEALRVRRARQWRHRLAVACGAAAAVALMLTLRSPAGGWLAQPAAESGALAGDPEDGLEAWLAAAQESEDRLTRSTSDDGAVDALDLLESEDLSPEDWQRSLDLSFEAFTEALGAS